MFFLKRCTKPQVNRIFIKDMIVEAAIGVFDHEKGKEQRIRVNITADVSRWPSSASDDLAGTVSYDLFVQHVFSIARNEGHIHLLETLADKIAQRCLAEDGVECICVRVEKLDIYPFAIPGVEITRRK